MSRKKWNLTKVDKDEALSLVEKYNIDPFTALLLVSRGLKTPELFSPFLDDGTPLHDPFEIIDMQKGVERINEAIFDFQKIAIVGDYDTDGVTATAIMYSYLDAQGADVFYYIPTRAQGYGLSRSLVDILCEKGTKLIITVDNGIRSVDETDYAKELGIDIVITDHHLPGDKIPNAAAVIDPHREGSSCNFKDWAGVGIAYKVVSAIEGAEPEALLPHFADLVALGTITDMVPLTGENRQLVKQGLRIINRHERFGTKALCSVSGILEKRVTASNIAFGLGPRLNAAGRMNSAERALKLLISDDYDEACELARDISLFNTSRQETELEILRCADEQIAKLPGLCFDKVLIVQGENWHEGVIGIVASRVAQKYLKPCIVLTTQDGITKGSGRSIEGFPLYDVLVHAKEHLSIYGGHSLAVGLSMDPANIDKFKDAVKEYTDKIEMPYPSLTVDLKLNPEFINVEMLDCLSSLEPFGSKNPAPRFGLYDMVIDDILHIGEKGNHIKIIAHKYGKDKKLQILKFWTFACDFPYKMGDRVDLVVSIEPNEFLGERKVSILLNDIRFYGTNDDEMVKGIKIFEKVMQCRILHEEACYALPSKELLTQIYKYIKSNNGWKYSYDILWGRINNPDNNYAKTAISIEVFKELGILNTNEKGHIIMPENISKVELGNSGILQYLSSFDKVKYGA